MRFGVALQSVSRDGADPAALRSQGPARASALVGALLAGSAAGTAGFSMASADSALPATSMRAMKVWCFMMGSELSMHGAFAEHDWVAEPPARGGCAQRVG